MRPLFLFLHVISAVVWIGGMFVAYMAVRPAAAQVLEPPQRLRLWAGIFRRFFGWVWGAAGLILLSGFSLMGQMAAVPAYVHAMLGIGFVMVAIFVYVYFVPFGKLRQHVAAEQWKSAGMALNQIRMLVGTNLALGLANVAVATLGPYVA